MWRSKASHIGHARLAMRASGRVSGPLACMAAVHQSRSVRSPGRTQFCGTRLDWSPAVPRYVACCAAPRLCRIAGLLQPCIGGHVALEGAHQCRTCQGAKRAPPRSTVWATCEGRTPRSGLSSEAGMTGLHVCFARPFCCARAAAGRRVCRCGAVQRQGYDLRMTRPLGQTWLGQQGLGVMRGARDTPTVACRSRWPCWPGARRRCQKPCPAPPCE